MEMNLFETSYRLINKYNQKTQKPKRYGIDDFLYAAEVHMIDTIGIHEKITTTKLAELLGITKGAVSQTTNKLVEKGLIEKHQSQERRNEVHIVLSNRGKVVFDYHHSMHARTQKKISDVLQELPPESVAAMSTIVELIEEMLDEM